MDNALNEKLDLSALHLGIISVGALLGAVVTLVACILAVRIITVLLRRVLGQDHAGAAGQQIHRQHRAVRAVGGDGADRGSAAGHPRDIAGGTVLGDIAGGVTGGTERAGQRGRAGLVLLVTKPFTVGDYIDTPSGEGTVREMSLTYTFLETMEGQRLAVPNSTLSSGKIINYSHAGHPAAPAQDHGLLRRCHGGRAKGLPDGGGADGQRAGRSCAGGVRQQLRREQHRVHRAVLDENRGLLAGVLSAAGGDTQRL